jgi:hypothetical protein
MFCIIDERQLIEFNTRCIECQIYSDEFDGVSDGVLGPIFHENAKSHAGGSPHGVFPLTI